MKELPKAEHLVLKMVILMHQVLFVVIEKYVRGVYNFGIQ